MVEFIGVLSVDPSLVNFGSIDEGNSLVDPIGEETMAERKAHSPPPSLIPRLHVITARLLAHSCPLLPREITQPVSSSGNKQPLWHAQTRDFLLTLKLFFFYIKHYF